MILQTGTSIGGATHFMRPVVAEEFNDAAIELPPGWCEVLSSSSRIYRPRKNSLPSVKVHYAPLMVDVDFKLGKEVTSKRIVCKSIADLIRVTKDQLWEWS